MMGKPKLLLLDEPSMGLAPVLVDLIFDTIETDPRPGRDDPARGAERPGGAAGRRLRVRAGVGRPQARGPAPGTRGGRRGHPRLPRRLTALEMHLRRVARGGCGRRTHMKRSLSGPRRRAIGSFHARWAPCGPLTGVDNGRIGARSTDPRPGVSQWHRAAMPRCGRSQRRAATMPVRIGATIRAGSRSPTGTCRIRSSRRAMPDQQQPPGRGEQGDLGSAEHGPQRPPEQRQRALVDAHDQRARSDAPAEAGGERDRGEAVHHRLERELVDAQAEAIGQRAEDRQRPDAEHQRRRDEALHEGVGRAASSISIGIRQGPIDLHVHRLARTRWSCRPRPLVVAGADPAVHRLGVMAHLALRSPRHRPRRRLRPSTNAATTGRGSTRPDPPAVPRSATGSRGSRRSAASRARSAPRRHPTASDTAGVMTAAADSAATSRTASPTPSVTTSRVRWGSRCPRATPIAEPIRIARTLMIVPRPIIGRTCGRCALTGRAGGRSGVRCTPAPRPRR